MQSILELTKTNKIILATFAFLVVLAFGSGRAHAATLNVSGGCTLAIAIDSVNAGSNQSGCTSSGSYGSSDTITIPAGTYVIPATLPTITEDVVITGAGMGQTVIDGDSDSKIFKADDVTIEISDLKITAYREYAIIILDSNVDLSNIEVDGTGAINPEQSITVSNTSGVNKTITADNIYMHDITYSTSRVIGFAVGENSGATSTVTLSNTTMADISNPGGSVNAFFIGVGGVNQFGGTGVMNATVSNTTMHNVTAGGPMSTFGGVSFADGGNATTNLTVNNATITGTRGVTGTISPLVGVKTAAFYAVTAAIGAGEIGAVNIHVSNSLLADNLTGTTSSNCETVDLTSGFGGAGTGVPVIISDGYNISDDATCAGFNQSGDQQNVSNIISTLGPLQNNGGNVPTRALLPGSPAINSGGSVLGVTTDARGIARNSCPSVGAFQFEGAVCAATTTNANAGGAAAPNTGAKTASTLGTVIASVLGLAILGYAAKKRA